MCKHTLVNEIDTELDKHSGIGALVNETTGQVHVFASPVPYFGLTPAERTALETERNGLLASVSGGGLRKRERRIAEDRIRRIESDLRRARSADESGRRTVERQDERAPQRYGQPGDRVTPTQQTLAEQVAATVAAVDAVTGAKSARKDSARLVRPWPDQLAPQAAPPKTAASAKVCCSGPKQYWCSKCKAKTGA
jgi:hypothetical protein